MRLLASKILEHHLKGIISIHGDAPRLHVKMPDHLRGIWMKAMADSGTLIINCNNMSWPLRENETHLMASYDQAFEAVTWSLTNA